MITRYRFTLLTLAVVLAVLLTRAVDLDYQSDDWGWFVAWRWAEGGVSVQWSGALSIWTLGPNAGRLWPRDAMPEPEPKPWPDVMIVDSLSPLEISMTAQN